MKTSFQLIACGVGVWMAIGATSVGYAQSVGQSQDEPDTPPSFHANATARSFQVTNAKQTKVTPTQVKLTQPVNPASLKFVAQTIPVRALKPIAPPANSVQPDHIRKPERPAAKPMAKAAPRSQVTAQATPPSAPLPTTSPAPRPTPSPTPTSPPASTPPIPTGSTPPSKAVPVPAIVNPSPNLLQFPTRPAEVTVRSTQQITLQQALELAERNNRDIQTARLQVERNRAVVREARAGNFPTLAITADLTRSGNSAFISQPDRNTDALSQLLGQTPTSGNVTTTSFSTGAQLNYDLYTSGARPAQIRAAERQSRSSELQLEQARETIRLQVTNDYYDLQDADQQVVINTAAVENAAANLRDAQAQERAGLGTRFDVLRAEVNLANFRQQLTNSLANQTVRRRQLAQRLSISEVVNLVADPVVQQAGTWTLPLEDSIILAYKNRAELEDQLVQRDLSQEQIRAARAANGPTLSFTANYQFQRSGTLDTDAANADSYSLALRAQWSLFDGGATNARIVQRQKDKEIAEVRFAQARNQVRFEVEQGYANLLANLDNITTTERAVTQAEEALRLAILRFQAGVGTQTDRINAETELTRARANRVSAIIGYNRALAQLQRAVSNIAR
jgi:OMF family outer membrane factor